MVQADFVSKFWFYLLDNWTSFSNFLSLNYLQNWDNNTDLLKVMRYYYFILIELAKIRNNKNNDC